MNHVAIRPGVTLCLQTGEIHSRDLVNGITPADEAQAKEMLKTTARQAFSLLSLALQHELRKIVEDPNHPIRRSLEQKRTIEA